MKHILGTTLFWAGNCFMVIAGITIAVALVFGWSQYGFSWIQQVLNPYNFLNVLITLIAFAPGFALRIAGEKLLQADPAEPVRLD